MKQHDVNELNNFICGWYMEDTTLCDKIIEYHKTAPNLQRGQVGKLNNPGYVDLKVKDSYESWLNYSGDLLIEYANNLQTCMNSYIDKYEWCNKYSPFTIVEATKIQHYKPNGAYFDYHCEKSSASSPVNNRHLVYMTYLNDVTDGGETEFFYQKLKVKPEKGLTLIWPAEWTFTHRGIPSPSQDKYVVTGWYNYIEVYSESENNADN